jgi:hypothetical protein
MDMVAVFCTVIKKSGTRYQEFYMAHSIQKYQLIKSVMFMYEKD